MSGNKRLIVNNTMYHTNNNHFMEIRPDGDIVRKIHISGCIKTVGIKINNKLVIIHEYESPISETTLEYNIPILFLTYEKVQLYVVSTIEKSEIVIEYIVLPVDTAINMIRKTEEQFVKLLNTNFVCKHGVVIRTEKV